MARDGSEMTDHEPPTRPLGFTRRREDDMRATARRLVEQMGQRRSVRQFSDEPVPRDLVEDAIRIGASAPSGAHLQPWTWVVVGDPDVKARLREAAEAEERAFYATRATPEWLEALAPLGTDDVKEHLTTAPWVVVLFRHRHEVLADGTRRKNYYSAESCGIAAGFFLMALHQVGLCSLTHTPSPMGFLAELLDRPSNEQAFLVMPVGYPADGARVPDIERRDLDDVTVWR